MHELYHNSTDGAYIYVCIYILETRPAPTKPCTLAATGSRLGSVLCKLTLQRQTNNCFLFKRLQIA